MLVETAPDFYSARQALRAQTAKLVSARPTWGATSELIIRNTYNVFNSDRQPVLRYEIDAIFPEDGDVNNMGNHASAMPAPPVHYGIYAHFNCDTVDGVEHFYIGGIQSLGEAVSAMKQAVKAALPHHHGVNMFDKRIELSGQKGQVQQRYTIEEGTRDENGNFLRKAGSDTEQAFVASARPGESGSRNPVLRLSSPEELEKPIQQHFQSFLSEVKLQVQAPCTSSTPVPQTMHQQAQALQPEADQDQQEENYCICRLPDDRSFMVACGNEQCPIEWYHGRCVNIQPLDVIDKEWYRESCRYGQQNNMGRGKGRTPAKNPPKRSGGGGRTKTKSKKCESGSGMVPG
ncbi:Chromatin modification protein [Pyrenophora tritici-repentis]|nr:Chromatin modification protein [Pyrenophora tritici-repentis]